MKILITSGLYVRSNIVLLDFSEANTYPNVNRCNQNLKDIAKEPIYYLDKLHIIMAIFTNVPEKFQK